MHKQVSPITAIAIGDTVSGQTARPSPSTELSKIPGGKTPPAYSMTLCSENANSSRYFRKSHSPASAPARGRVRCEAGAPSGTRPRDGSASKGRRTGALRSDFAPAQGAFQRRGPRRPRPNRGADGDRRGEAGPGAGGTGPGRLRTADRSGRSGVRPSRARAPRRVENRAIRPRQIDPPPMEARPAIPNGPDWSGESRRGVGRIRMKRRCAKNLGKGGRDSKL
jgi:hypothetical protein